ncbi:hypothetical protein K504DRAFT_486672 [Pleomassaria siparia CBS 279.74]|uniref:Pentatricopeptide repeat protein n=1 Tax=Pleomassaria siparia CBS 279.74 TaxID=1314801 RepID=A0A6G1KQN9_9PLEO|nr:hypothetical protein K504DRAFT_486672 [Pleomassaria siparia CBS 279.74]
MLSSYICRQCRARLMPRATFSPNPRWQPRATFISLRPKQPAQSEAQAESHDESTLENSTDGLEVASKIRRVEFDPPSDPARDNLRDKRMEISKGSRTLRPGRYSGYIQDAEAYGSEEVASYPQVQYGDFEAAEPEGYSNHAAEDMQEDLESASQGQTTTRVPFDSLTPAVKMDKLLRKGRVDEAWSVFLQEFGSSDSAALSNPAQEDLILLQDGKIFAHLMKKITDHFCSSPETVRTPTRALFVLQQRGIAPRDFWAPTITTLTYQLLFTVSGMQENRSSDEILSELTSVWRLFYQCHGREEDPLESISTEWLSIPGENELSKFTGFEWENPVFTLRMQQFHPKYVGNPALGFSAITYFNLLDEVNKDVLQASDSVRQQATPFLRFLTRVLAGSKVKGITEYATWSNDFRRLSTDFQEALLGQIKSAPSEAMLAVNSGTAGRENISPEERAANLERSLYGKINSTMLSQEHTGKLVELWERVQGFYAPNNRHGNAPVIPSRLYNGFLTGFMALSVSSRAVEVWNHAVAHGVKPDIKTWTAMLYGCSRAKDLEGLNAMWGKLMKSGLEPDDYAWTAYVNGLMRVRQVNAGFAVMDDMGRRWIAAEKAINTPPKRGTNKKVPKVTVNPYTKPDIAVVNGAMTAIVALPKIHMKYELKKHYAQKLLQWAGNFSIKPDRRTYNTLVKLYIDGRDYTTSFKILRQMEKDGIKADGATYTMLIRSAFDNDKFANLTESEQLQRVMAIFNELETGGVKLEETIYAAIIDRLLKQYENFAAVKVIIEHMTARNLNISPHIYTSLITQYFRQTPPNIDAVDTLWQHLISTRRAQTDKILFDRIIEGYAHNNQIDRMMALLVRMTSHGKLPSYDTLTAIVTALGQVGEWERIHQLVRDVVQGTGVMQGIEGATGGRKGREFFFHVVVEKLGIDLTTIPGLDLGAETNAQLAGAHGSSPGAADEGGAQQSAEQSERDRQYDERQEAQRAWNEQINNESEQVLEPEIDGVGR